MMLSELEIRNHLRDVTPWFLADTNLRLLHDKRLNTTEELTTEVARMDYAGKLVYAASYENSYQEFLSKNIEVDDNESVRRECFRIQKNYNEQLEAESLRQELRGVPLRDGLVLQDLPLETLRATAQAVREQRRQQATSAADLRQEVKQARNPRQPRADGFVWMPETICLPAGLRVGDKVTDGIRAWKITPEILYAFSKAARDSHEYWWFKERAYRIYGGQQITERMANRQAEAVQS